MATYYISPTGNDSTGDGSESLPWLTISKVYSESTDEDTIKCINGPFTVGTAQELEYRTWESSVTGTQVTFDGGGATRTVDIDGTNATTVFTDIHFDDFVCGTNLPFFGLQYNTTRPANLTCTRCTFSNISLTNYQFLRGGQSGLYNATFIGCLWYGITFVAGAGQQFFHEYNAGSQVGTIILNNCTIYLESPCYLSYNSSAQNWILFQMNNTIIDNESGGVVQTRDMHADSYANNCDFLNITETEAIPNKTNCLTDIDPLFVDVTSNNFNLRPTSPCIATGTLL